MFEPRDVEDTIYMALARRFKEKLYYVQSFSNPADLRAIRLRPLAKEMADALTVKAVPLRATLPKCVDDGALERAREVLAEFDTLKPFLVREAMHALFEEAVRLRMLLGEAEDRLARHHHSGADREASAATPER